MGSALDPRDITVGMAIDLATQFGPEAVRRLVLIVLAEGEGYVWANDGAGLTGGAINPAQAEAVRASLALPFDTDAQGEKCIGHNGGSVGPTQATPTEVATVADKPWRGWGTVAQCMDREWILTKTLAALLDVPFTGDPVADCHRVQRWLGDSAGPEWDNYRRRVPSVDALLAAWHPRYFTDGGTP